MLLSHWYSSSSLGSHGPISSSIVPMVMDFGISHLLEGSAIETATKAQNGSLRWLAPELLTGEEELHTNQSDIWALGMTYLVRNLHICSESLPIRLRLCVRNY